MRKKKILMLGGSAQQVPAIKKAKELGYETILIDYLPDNPGQYIADKWYMESTTDVESVFYIAKKEIVDGILPYASDPAAVPAAIVAERLGLPTNPSKSVEILGVKHKFREFLNKNGFPAPKSLSFTSNQNIDVIIKKISTLKFPIVIKPTDSSGSKGVSFVSDISNIRNAIEYADKYSRNKILIAEEFIERGFADVIGGDIFVENGLITLYGDMACLRGDNGKSLIPIGEKKPNGLNISQQQSVHKELQRLITALGITNGELNIEIIIDKNNVPYFLELGPRAGGNMIPIQLSDIFNVDLIEANVKSALGEKVNLQPKESKESYATYVLHSLKNGILKNINYSKVIQPYIYRKAEYKKSGENVDIFDGAGKALGIVFLKFPDEKLMNKFLSEIDKHIIIDLV